MTRVRTTGGADALHCISFAQTRILRRDGRARPSRRRDLTRLVFARSTPAGGRAGATKSSPRVRAPRVSIAARVVFVIRSGACNVFSSYFQHLIHPRSRETLARDPRSSPLDNIYDVFVHDVRVPARSIVRSSASPSPMPPLPVPVTRYPLPGVGAGGGRRRRRRASTPARRLLLASSVLRLSSKCLLHSNPVPGSALAFPRTRRRRRSLRRPLSSDDPSSLLAVPSFSTHPRPRASDDAHEKKNFLHRMLVAF